MKKKLKNYLIDDTSDNNGHGTIVAGLTAGNGPKYYGVAPAAKLIHIKAVGSNGLSDNSQEARRRQAV
ncbi:MAG: S8 family serine peptidase [Peptococcaceae bacterium]|nr:S8 family serine peptidase [Peptococcaceae bacterium]